MENKLSLNDMATFKIKYRKACKEGATSFQFKGMEILTAYVKYCIEYSTLIFARNGKD